MRTGIALALTGLALVSGCKKPEPAVPEVTNAWVRLSPLPDHPSAGYFELHGGAAADRLIAASSPAAQAIQMHQTMAAAMTGTRTPDLSPSMTAMRPLPSVPMPPHSVTSFQPGGDHLMIFGVSADVKTGGTMPLAFTLASGRRIVAEAQVVAAGDPDPTTGSGG